MWARSWGGAKVSRWLEQRGLGKWELAAAASEGRMRGREGARRGQIYQGYHTGCAEDCAGEESFYERRTPCTHLCGTGEGRSSEDALVERLARFESCTWRYGR